jgi:hypothetical protein
MSNAVTVPADKLAQLQREAARYRWLRDQWDRIGVLDGVMFSKSSDGTAWVGAEVLDKRIDAAMLARGVMGLDQTEGAKR